jgi:hypothetical protein
MIRLKKQKMMIKINKESLVAKVQQEFSASYPFLKIEFFKNHRNVKSKDQPISTAERFGHLTSLNGNTFHLNIDEKRKVAELKNDFKELFGITADIFRRSGNMWIETSLTDDWSLEKQNNEGEQISSQSHYPTQKPGSVINY